MNNRSHQLYILKNNILLSKEIFKCQNPTPICLNSLVRVHLLQTPKHLKTQDMPFLFLNVPQMLEKQTLLNLVESIKIFQIF